MRFSMLLLLASVFAGLSLMSLPGLAETPAFKEGEQYKLVRDVQKPIDPKRILVEEAFWYGCQHCFHFDPKIEAWRKTRAADVDFARLPSSLGHPEGVLHQKAYFTAQSLNIGDKIHTPLFDAIHVKHDTSLFTQGGIATLFYRQAAISEEVFNGTFTGFAVDSQVRRTDALLRAYGIASVPAIVVGGKYTTNASLAGDFDKMIKVTDFLIEKVRQERKK